LRATPDVSEKPVRARRVWPRISGAGGEKKYEGRFGRRSFTFGAGRGLIRAGGGGKNLNRGEDFLGEWMGGVPFPAHGETVGNSWGGPRVVCRANSLRPGLPGGPGDRRGGTKPQNRNGVKKDGRNWRWPSAQDFSPWGKEGSGKGGGGGRGGGTHHRPMVLGGERTGNFGASLPFSLRPGWRGAGGGGGDPLGFGRDRRWRMDLQTASWGGPQPLSITRGGGGTKTGILTGAKRRPTGHQGASGF